MKAPEKPKEGSEKGSQPGMIGEIEKEGENDNDDINLEYFVGGQKKYSVKHHNHHQMSEKFSKEVLLAENTLLRNRLKNEMGKRIADLELNEMILKAKNMKLGNENEKLNERIRKLEEENRKLREK